MYSFLSKLAKPKWIEFALGLLCLIAVVLTQVFDNSDLATLINELDAQIYDEIVSLTLTPPRQEPKVIIIDIDEQSILKEGRWPWPRNKMAKLISLLKQNGVVSLGVDIVMPEAEINYALGLRDRLLQLGSPTTPAQQTFFDNLVKIAPAVDNDQSLAKALLDHNVVLGFLFDNNPDSNKGTLPPPLSYSISDSTKIDNLGFFDFLGYIASLDLLIKASTKGGFVTNYPDWDGTVRRTVLIAKFQGNLYPSLALATAMNYLLVNKATIDVQHGQIQGIKLDGTYIPTNTHAQSLIPFWGPPHTLEYYSATDILQSKVDPKLLQGSVAIIGSTLTLLSDLHDSPVASAFPGLEMVGNIVQGIINQEGSRQYNWHTPMGLGFFILIGLIISFLLPFLHVSLKIMLSLLSLSAILLATFFIYKYQHLFIPTAPLLILIILQSSTNFTYAFVIERMQKRKISQLFGQYVPEDYVKELINSPDKYSMEGQTRNMTVLFVDIRSFTSISETLDANGVKRLLNTFFTPLTEIIFNHRGTIDKYVGDMVVAFWNAPIEDTEHVYHAIMASLTIFQKLPEINAKMLENNLPPVNIGLGLATGLMNVGDMGSEFRRAYTVLGDTVNLGSRLQDLTKYYKVNILVSSATREGQDRFEWRPIDKVAVKGRKTALTIYEPIGLAADSGPELKQELAEYEEALQSYYKQNWEAAEKEFTRLKKAHPEIYVYTMYLDRIAHFKQTPPPKDWDGVLVHETK